ncbi:helix-turn-helix domain-containing protein [Mannheimia sp. AT1]|uniref:Helix-turn-helix domain-containing protein n=1 Tax=Mannheimia cairinae TaxID=3025936 RepID=A0ABT5MSF3_9PAST|nr:helix-turn-helix domain-containing protein [Mannheimia cairinae]MDD0824893.1 helix-turn-helix domain-containing protein [Mannheimia cairinae]MDD0826177.1 helix-turn-helix domain-containing protein [Mannheimia cairinae]
MKLSVELQNQINQLNQLRKQALKQEQEERKLFERSKLDNLEEFGKQLNVQRKTLGIELATLEMQTGISTSTLKRLFKDPSQVKFQTICTVAETLGFNLCVVNTQQNN